jgi:hypothetical protein
MVHDRDRIVRTKIECLTCFRLVCRLLTAGLGVAFCISDCLLLSQIAYGRQDAESPAFSGAFCVSAYNGGVSESNRQRALFTPATGFEDLNPIAASTEMVVTSEPSDNSLAFCLAFLSRVSPDLALVVERWSLLPEAMRTGILAMVKASL